MAPGGRPQTRPTATDRTPTATINPAEQTQVSARWERFMSRIDKPANKVAANKIKKIYTDYKGTTYDPELLKNTGYARKVDLEKGIKNRKQSTGSN